MSTEKELTPEEQAARTAADALIEALPDEITAVIMAWTERLKNTEGIKAEDHIQIGMSALVTTEMRLDDFWKAVPARIRIGFPLIRPRVDHPNPYRDPDPDPDPE